MAPGSPGVLTDPASHFPETYPKDTVARTGHGLCVVALLCVQGTGSPSYASSTWWGLGPGGHGGPLGPMSRLQDMHEPVFTLLVFKRLPGGQDDVTSEHRVRACATMLCFIILQME